MAKVTLYTTDNCGFCMMAKQLLTQRGVEFEETYVSRSDEEKRLELYQRSKMKTFPQIFNGENLVGGFQELEALDQKDQLASLK